MDDLPLYAQLLQPACAVLWRIEAAREAEAHWRHVATCHALDEGRRLACAQADRWARAAEAQVWMLGRMEAAGLVGVA